MNRIIEYIIQAKDRTSAALQSALAKVKKFGDSVASTMRGASSSMSTDAIEEKFIHTARVLDTVGKALDSLGIEGKDFGEAMDTLEKHLDRVNKNGGDTTALFAHFKASMSELGLSTKQINDGLEMLKRNLVGAGTSGAAAGKALRTDMRTAHMMLGAINGNVYSLGRAFTFLLGKIKALKISVSTLSLISVAIVALSEVISKAVTWWEKKKEAMEKVQQLRFEDTLAKYSREQSEVNKEIKRGISYIDSETERKKRLIQHNAKLIEQQIEINRLEALKGTTGAERDQINKDFDAERDLLKAKTTIQTAEVEAIGQANIDAMLAKAQERLKPIKERLEKQLREAAEKVAKEEERGRKIAAVPDITVASQYLGPSPWTEEDKKNKFETWQAEDENYRKLRDKRDRLQKEYDGILEDLKDFEERRTKAQDKIESLKFDIEETAADSEIDALKAEEEAAHDYYKEMERLEKERTKEAEREARERARVQKELYREAAQEYKATLRELDDAERTATANLKAAEKNVEEAWGFYKDSGKMQAHIDEQTKEIAARQKYEKDVKALERGSWSDELATAKRLNRRGETDKLEEMFAKWRSGSFGLSVEQEATMRVAVAKDEEKQAQKALEEIRDQMNEATAHFEHISEAIGNIEGLLEEGGE